jgi:hypothetical protein
MQVGEVTSASAGDEYFFADPVGVFEYGYATAALSGFYRAH